MFYKISGSCNNDEFWKFTLTFHGRQLFMSPNIWNAGSDTKHSSILFDPHKYPFIKRCLFVFKNYVNVEICYIDTCDDLNREILCAWIHPSKTYLRFFCIPIYKKGCRTLIASKEWVLCKVSV